MFDFILLLVLLILLLNIVFYTLKIGISPMPSSKKVLIKIDENVKLFDFDTIIDLGSGFGTLAIYIAINNPTKKVIGYELSLIPFIISNFLKIILKIKNLEFKKKNFLFENLDNKVLITYLFPKGMEKLENKIKDSKIKSILISSTFKFRNIKEDYCDYCDDIYNTPIFLYKFS